MAHYLAELIQMVESAGDVSERRQAQSACCDLILRLWSNRDRLPSEARPLGRLKDVMESIRRMEDHRDACFILVGRASESGANPWLEFAESSYAAEKRMASIALLAGLVEKDLGPEKKWIAEHASHLEDDECDLIDLLDSQLHNSIDWLTREDRTSIADLEPEQRESQLLDELKSIVDAQRSALETLSAALSTRSG